MRYWRLLIIVGLVAVMVLAGTSVAYAQGPKLGGEGLALGGRGMGMGRTHLSSAALAAVAQKLNMTPEQLTTQLRGGAILADLADTAGVDLQVLRDAANAADKQAAKDAIEQAVTDGRLTRERADWMLQGIEQGYSVSGKFGFGFGMGMGVKGDNTQLEAAAQVLKMTADQLELQLWGGRTLAQLAERAGVTLEAVQTAMQNARVEAQRAAIEQAVTDGKLTRQQADWLLQGLENGYLDRGGGLFPGGRGHGHGGGLGMHQAPGRQQQQQTPAPSTAGGARFQAPARSAGQSI